VVIPQSELGTLAANLLGVALAVFFLVLMERRGITSLRYFLLPGFCGGMTTFSAVTYQIVGPENSGIDYLVLTILTSIAIAHITMLLSRRYVKARTA
jgi:CrcB protein